MYDPTIRPYIHVRVIHVCVNTNVHVRWVRTLAYWRSCTVIAKLYKYQINVHAKGSIPYPCSTHPAERTAQLVRYTHMYNASDKPCAREENLRAARWSKIKACLWCGFKHHFKCKTVLFKSDTIYMYNMPLYPYYFCVQQSFMLRSSYIVHTHTRIHIYTLAHLSAWPHWQWRDH